MKPEILIDLRSTAPTNEEYAALLKIANVKLIKNDLDALIHEFPLVVETDSQYKLAVKRIDALLSTKLDAGGLLYLDMLGDRVHTYEATQWDDYSIETNVMIRQLALFKGVNFEEIQNMTGATYEELSTGVMSEQLLIAVADYFDVSVEVFNETP
jgi:hypothetical protein